MRILAIVVVLSLPAVGLAQETKHTPALGSQVYEFLAHMQSLSPENHWWVKNGDAEGQIPEVVSCLAAAGKRKVGEGRVMKYMKSCMQKKGWEYEPVQTYVST